MSTHALLLSARLLDGCYYGVGDWPPSPFRLFQALVSAAHTGRRATEAEIQALRWLENLDAPIIATPKARQSKTTTYYVPRNGADSPKFDGDLAKAAKARDEKLFRPWLFDDRIPFLYLWNFDAGSQHAETITRIADLLYQFGRGVDMAFALAETVEAEEAERRLAEHPGSIHRPTPSGTGLALRCPRKMLSLDSLDRRHTAQLNRLKGGNFRQAPPPIFEEVGYGCPPVRFVYDVRGSGDDHEFSAQPLEKIAAFAETLRDHAVERLRPHHQQYVERVITGRTAENADKALRVRIVPLPSIGHEQTNQDIRRVLVEVPPNCPIPAADINWAFAGLTVEVDNETGEITGPVLIPATESKNMLDHYGIYEDGKGQARIWRTVTPAALPVVRPQGKRNGEARAIIEAEAAHAALQALRHAGFERLTTVRRIQREPFDAKGECAGAFAHGERFAADRLYHLEIEFGQPVPGPVLIGDGRYFGLGLLRPVRDVHRDIVVLPLSSDNRPPIAERGEFLEAVRRALMALARDFSGHAERKPGRLFSGHEPDGAPARSGRHDHVFLAADDSDGDGLIDRLLIVAPWRADRTPKAWKKDREDFERVTGALEIVRAGRLGVFEFAAPEDLSEDDRIARRSRHWISATPYVPTRFPKRREEVRGELAKDLMLECRRRGLPRPNVEIIELDAGPHGGLRATVRLEFAVAVAGPLLLGRDSHAGGGLFCAEPALE
jgi:CRISPR-associated protein Csb2